MPKLAMGMSQGTVTKWQYAEGQFVEKGKILLVIETEKVSYDIEAVKSGYLKIIVPEGETVPINTIIAYLAESEAELSTLGGGDKKPDAVAPEAPAAPAAVEQPAPKASGEGGRIIASPLAKKLAQANGIDLSLVTGTGPGGRIQKVDVLNAVEARKEAPAASPAAAPAGAAPSIDDVKGRIKAILPIKGMRKSIGEGMKKSLDSAAQLSYSAEFDATEIVRLRERLVAKEKKVGLRVSVFDILAYIFARAIKKVPILNASLVGDQIKVWEDVNLGIAIATEISEYEGGLYVPVVKKADAKSLFDISREIKELTAKTRNGQLKLEDMQGGTATISSVSFVSPLFASTPILNMGEALLIQPGSILDRPAVKNGEIVIRPTITMSFTFDHRISDGLPLGKLTRYITDFMEDPEMLL